MKKIFSRIGKRPIILLFIFVASLPFCAFEQFNAFTQKYGSLQLLFSNDYLTNLSNLANGFALAANKPWLTALNVLMAVLFVLAIALVMGVLFGGYFQCLYLAVNDVPKKKNDFKLGVNRHFPKLTMYFTVLIVSFYLMAMLTLFSVAPFMVHLQMFLAGDSSVIFKMMLLAVLTLLLGYFTIIFYSMYMSYMLPALVGFKKGGVMVSLKMTNGYCWYLMPRTTLFLVLMLGLKIGLLAMDYGLARGTTSYMYLGLNWVLTTIFVFGYLYYVFNIFTIMKEDMFTTAEEK